MKPTLKGIFFLRQCLIVSMVKVQVTVSQERKEQQNILIVRKRRGSVNEVMQAVTVAKKE
jgi:hypothetical protein